MGNCYLEMGKFADALKLYEESLKITKLTHGDQHISVKIKFEFKF